MKQENNVESLLLLLDPTPMYMEVFKYAETVAMYITPVLFLLAIYIRIMETQLSGLTQGPKWGEALKDIVMWGTVISVYFGLFALVSAFVNPIYAWIEQPGSIGAITDKFNEINAALGEQYRNQTTGEKVTDLAFAAVSSPLQVGAVSAYYLTLYAAAYVTALLKIAHAYAFGVAFVWGLIAIPISISKNMKLSRGWALLVGFTLAWPLIQGVMIALFAPLFSNAADHIIHGFNGLSTVKSLDVNLLFSTVHLLLIAILIAAPFVTARLIANTSSGGEMVMPFVGAALAAAAVTFNVNKPIRMPGRNGSNGSNPTPGFNGGNGPNPTPGPRPVQPSTRNVAGANSPSALTTQRLELPSPVPRAAATNNVATQPPSAPQPAGHTVNAPSSAPADASASETASTVTRKKIQARRGAILNQRKSAKVKPL